MHTMEKTTDCEPDYSTYSLSDLRDVEVHIDKDKYPERFNRIREEIKRRPQEHSVKVAESFFDSYRITSHKPTIAVPGIFIASLVFGYIGGFLFVLPAVLFLPLGYIRGSIRFKKWVDYTSKHGLFTKRETISIFLLSIGFAFVRPYIQPFVNPVVVFAFMGAACGFALGSGLRLLWHYKHRDSDSDHAIEGI
jgi:hypothetical protein